MAINTDWWDDDEPRASRGVVTSRRPFGTASRTFEGYNYDAMPIAGKTGTAQDAAQEGNKDDSLFAGYGPNGGPGTAQWVVGGGRRGRWLRRLGGGAHRQVHVLRARLTAARMAPARTSPNRSTRPATTPTPIGPMPELGCMAINDARGSVRLMVGT